MDRPAPSAHRAAAVARRLGARGTVMAKPALTIPVWVTNTLRLQNRRGLAVSFPRFSGHPSAWSESHSVMKEERYATAVSAAVSAGVPARGRQLGQGQRPLGAGGRRRARCQHGVASDLGRQGPPGWGGRDDGLTTGEREGLRKLRRQGAE